VGFTQQRCPSICLSVCLSVCSSVASVQEIWQQPSRLRIGRHISPPVIPSPVKFILAAAYWWRSSTCQPCLFSWRWSVLYSGENVLSAWLESLVAFCCIIPDNNDNGVANAIQCAVNGSDEWYNANIHRRGRGLTAAGNQLVVLPRYILYLWVTTSCLHSRPTTTQVRAIVVYIACSCNKNR